MNNQDTEKPTQQIIATPQENPLSLAMQIQTNYLNPDVFNQMRAMARVFHQSKAIGACYDNEAKVVVALQAGYEMGMTPLEALNSLYVVNGSVNIWGKATVKRFREHGWDIAYEMDVKDGGSCTATVTKNGKSYSETATFSNAQKSKYTHDRNGNLKVGWYEGENRKRKLRYMALSTILHNYLPDLLGAVSGVQEVMEDVQEEVPTQPAKQITKIASAVNDINQVKSLSEKLKAAREERQNVKVTPQQLKVEMDEKEVVEND